MFKEKKLPNENSDKISVKLIFTNLRGKINFVSLRKKNYGFWNINSHYHELSLKEFLSEIMIMNLTHLAIKFNLSYVNH